MHYSPPSVLGSGIGNMMRSLGLRTNDVAPRVLKVVFYLGEMALRRWLGHEEEVADEKAEMRAIVDDVSSRFSGRSDP